MFLSQNHNIRYEFYHTDCALTFSTWPKPADCTATWVASRNGRTSDCRTTSQVEPLVRAWFLGDCIPGIVADFIEERGEGEEWLLRLLRDDPEWHASLPTPIRGQTAEMIIIDDPVADGVPDPEQARRMREWYDEYRRRLAERRERETDSTPGRPVMLPTVDWTYRPNDRIRLVTNPSDDHLRRWADDHPHPDQD